MPGNMQVDPGVASPIVQSGRSSRLLESRKERYISVEMGVNMEKLLAIDYRNLRANFVQCSKEIEIKRVYTIIITVAH